MKRSFVLTIVLALLLAACAAPAPEVVEKEVIVEKEVPVTVEVEKEVIVEKPVVQTVEVEKEVIVEKEVKEKVTLKYFMWDPSLEELELSIIDQYTSMNPYVTIEFEALEPTDYWPKMSALAAAGEMPDVFNMSSGYVDEYASKNLMGSIEYYIERDINPDDYFTGVFSAVRYPDKETGSMRAMPFAWVCTVLYYNQDAFDAAGVEYPAEGWTWDDFLDAAKKLTVDKDGDGMIDQYGFWLYGRYAHIESWIYQNNGRFLNAAKTRFEPDDNAVETLEFLNSLIHEHKVAPMPKEMEGIRQQDVFPQGMAAMWIDGSWNIQNNRDVGGDAFQWGIAPIPRGPHWEKDQAYGWPDSIAMSPITQHADEVWNFIKYLTGPGRPASSFMGGKVPILKATALSEEFLEKDQQPANKGFLLEWGENLGPNSFTPGWGEWRGYTGGAGLEAWLDQAYNGEVDMATAIEEATKSANEVLTRFYPEP
jgi:multiple sugar transport system substrate-binding protein